MPGVTCISICLISAIGPGVSRLSSLVESLAMLGHEVLPQVLHVLDLPDLHRRPRLHRLAERLVNLTCGENLLLPLLVVESLGCTIVLQSLSSRLDVPSVELRPDLLLNLLLDLLPGPGPALSGTRRVSAEA